MKKFMGVGYGALSDSDLLSLSYEGPIFKGFVLGKRTRPETNDDTETVQPGSIPRHPTAPTPSHVVRSPRNFP